MKPQTLELLTVTAELCGHVMSDAAARLLVADLETYPEEQVIGALAKCRRELRGRLTLPEILSRLDDDRPGADEAWAMMPKSEHESAVLPQEILTAWGIVHDLYCEDPVGARVAFRDAYNRLVSEARAQRDPIDWVASLGYEKSGRIAAVSQAVYLGRMTEQRARAVCGELPADPMQLKAPKRDVKALINQTVKRA